MDKASRDAFELQLKQVEDLLLQENIAEKLREDLLDVKQNIVDLLDLTKEPTPGPSSSMDDEYERFLAEIGEMGTDKDTNEDNNCEIESAKDSQRDSIETEPAKDSEGNISCEIESAKDSEVGDSQQQEAEADKVDDKFKNIHEGMKCRVPHEHTWGGIVNHNAIVVGIKSDENSSEPLVTVLYTHPTHSEMLTCPYYYDQGCKFSDEKCRYSHGETFLASVLMEYLEPDFGELKCGSGVLAKMSDNLWHKGKIRDVNEEHYFVRLEGKQTDMEVSHGDIFPLPIDTIPVDSGSSSSSSSEEDDDHQIKREEIINRSLLLQPSSTCLGPWEKYTKGIGSKLMQKMGYIVGSGLGKNADGRVEPVTALVLPAGKSLDYCMELKNKDEKRACRKRRRNKGAHASKKQEKVNKFLNNFLKLPQDGRLVTEDDFKFIKGTSDRGLSILFLEMAHKAHNCRIFMSGIQMCIEAPCNAAPEKQSHLKAKLAARKTELARYKALDKLIDKETSSRDKVRMMTYF